MESQKDLQETFMQKRRRLQTSRKRRDVFEDSRCRASQSVGGACEASA